MTLGRLAGVKIKISPLFFMLLLYAAINTQLVAITIFFLLVLVHEIGHIIMALYLKLNVYEINLLPLGGRVQIASGAEIEPENEVKLALAGPIVNIVILSFIIFGNSFIPAQYQSIADIFIKGNIVLIVFNMLPILPLDGGRVYRAMLVKNRGYVDATRYILLVSIIIIIFLIISAVVGIVFKIINITLLVMGLFLLLNFLLEYRTYRLQFFKHYLVSETPVQKKIWNTNTLTVSENTPAKKVIKQFVPGKFNLVVLIDFTGKVVGRLTETQIMKAVRKKGPTISLKSIYKNN